MKNTNSQDLLNLAAKMADDYLNSLNTRRVYPDQAALDGLSKFDRPLLDNGMPAEQVLSLLHKHGSPATVTTNGDRYFGLVMGATLPVTIASNYLSSVWDQNAVLYKTSPVAAQLEQIALKWTLDLLKLPPQSAGGFVTGTSVAHITALTTACDAVLNRIGWDANADGLIGAPGIKVIVSEDAHATLFKALGIVGLGRNNVIKIPVDSQGRMIASKIPRTTEPTIICCQAGNVNSGAFDPFKDICQIAKSSGAWVHIDGAFGLWANACDRTSHLTDGIQFADSWATDYHKWLNVPYDSGLVIVKNKNDLTKAMRLTTSYLPEAENTIGKEQRNPSQFVPELSRRARGIDAWSALATLGRTGVSDLIDKSCHSAKYFADGLSKAGFEILNDVVINQVLVSFGCEKKNKAIISYLEEQGLCWFGGAVWNGQFVMRISVSSWKTDIENIDYVLKEIIVAAGKYPNL